MAIRIGDEGKASPAQRPQGVRVIPIHMKAKPKQTFVNRHPALTILGMMAAVTGVFMIPMVTEKHQKKAADESTAQAIQALEDIGPLTRHSPEDGKQIIDDVQAVCMQAGMDCVPIAWNPQDGRMESKPVSTEALVNSLQYVSDHFGDHSDGIGVKDRQARAFGTLAIQLAHYKRPAQPPGPN